MLLAATFKPVKTWPKRILVNSDKAISVDSNESRVALLGALEKQQYKKSPELQMICIEQNNFSEKLTKVVVGAKMGSTTVTVWLLV